MRVKSTYYKYRVFWVVAITLWAISGSPVHAAPFDQCPSEAFLIQDSVARIYGVNLATGFYEELSNDMGTTGKINGIGFNNFDQYIYGWGYEFGSIIKFGSDLTVEIVPVSGLPNTNFYVGDVSLTENAYYFYKRGSSFGLYKAVLDSASPAYMSVEQIIDGSSLDLRIFDFAFHPTNPYLYSVDRNGVLVRISSSDGSSIQLGNVGESGTFGAVYFDVDENFYISRNSDGFIFRIDVTDAEPTAEFFAFGPDSSNNDGARCALAEIVPEGATVDFGDAPASYGTDIENNGARHEISGDLYLGDNASGTDDGVDIVTGFESGLDTLLQVRATGEGVLNVWIDWDQNGQFENEESALQNISLSDGENRLLIDVPIDAAEGSTWARFRYSSTEDIGPTGGVSDGEVEDYPITVTQTGLTIESYPSSNNFVTLAYEDNWPHLGDYDMNDVVMAFRTRRFIDSNNRVVRYDVEGHLLALGASYHNGFAIQLDGVATANVNQSMMRFELNGVLQTTSALEENLATEDAVIVVLDDLWDGVRQSSNSTCLYFRTEAGCLENQQMVFLISVPLIESIPAESSPENLLNPFIFATPDLYHGDDIGLHPGRGLEIHLKNNKVSPRFNSVFLGMSDDESDIENGLTFLSANNMPWAIEMPTLWSHPYESVDIVDAYPNFDDYVESNGQSQVTWYMRSQAQQGLVIDNE